MDPYGGIFMAQLLTMQKENWREKNIKTHSIEANLLNMPSVGIELSEFSFLIAKVKNYRF